jgi:hypothetical protein
MHSYLNFNLSRSTRLAGHLIRLAALADRINLLNKNILKFLLILYSS